MENKLLKMTLKTFLIPSMLFFVNFLSAQQTTSSSYKNNFWSNVQIGGGIGVGIGSGYTDISVSPSAIYNINPVVSIGTSLQFAYASSKNYYSTMYGGSIIGLINPLPQMQLSVELEEMNVATKYDNQNIATNFWNTALYIGAAYRSGNVSIGVRYDVLFNPKQSYYSDAFMPFIRAYF